MDEHESNSNPPPSKDHETENVCTESENVDVVEEDMLLYIAFQGCFCVVIIDHCCCTDVKKIQN